MSSVVLLVTVIASGIVYHLAQRLAVAPTIPVTGMAPAPKFLIFSSRSGRANAAPARRPAIP